MRALCNEGNIIYNLDGTFLHMHELLKHCRLTENPQEGLETCKTL